MDLSHVSQSLGVVHPICLARGLNAEVWDEQGKRYVDFVGGIGALNLGHCHPLVVEAVKAQLETLMHSAFNAIPHRGYLSLARKLADFVPVSYPLSCMLTNSGAEATENALKVSRAFTQRQGVIAFDDAFHGRTLAALNLNGKVAPYKQQLGALPGPVYHLPFPSSDGDVTGQQAKQALARLFEVEIPASEVACIIVEPVQGEGGFRFLCPDFAAHLAQICAANGIVLIFDEIQSGFGRTGSRFAFTHLDVEPDLILMGKSMAAGLPLAAVAGRADIMNVLPKGGLGGTYSGNALACAAASTVIELMSDDTLMHLGAQQEQSIQQAYDKWLASGRYPMLGRLTGVGAMRGIVFNDTATATGREHLARLLSAGRTEGVLLMPSGRHRHVLRLLAPLTTEPTIMAEGLACLERALDSLTE